MESMMRRRGRAVRCGLLVAVLGMLFGAAAVAQPETAVPELKRAEESYGKGRFDEAILILKDFLEKPDLAESEQEAALRLLGLTYLAKDYRDEARDAVTKLLRLVPDYEADPEADPPPYVEMVTETKEDLLAQEEQKSGGITKWYYVAGIAVVGGLAAGLAGGGGGGGGEPKPDEYDPISHPPGLPQ